MGFNRGMSKRVYMAKTAESPYDTAATLTHYFNLQSEHALESPELYSDDLEAGGGEEERSKGLLAKDAKFTLSGRASNTFLPMILAFGLGADTHTVPSGGDTVAFQHLIAPYGWTTELLSTTVEMHNAGATDATAGSSIKFSGCVVDSFSLTVARKGWAQLSADFIGSGTTVTGGSQTEGSLVAPAVYYPNGMCAAWVGTDPEVGWPAAPALPTTSGTRVSDILSTNIIALSTHLREVTYKCANNLMGDEGYTFNSGTSRGALIRDKRVQTIDFTVDYNTTTCAMVPYVEDLTAFAFELSCVTETLLDATTDYYHGWKILFPQCRMESAKPGGGLGPQTITFSARVEDDQTLATVYAYVWNGEDADYAG